MNARNELAERATLYIDGKPFGIVGEPRFVSELNGIEKWEMTVAPKENSTSFTIEMEADYQILRARLPKPPKRPPNPERPMWAINPGRTRRNAFGPSRRVK